jgi:hypothetical protein
VPRGGHRTPTNGKKIGRPKVERPVDGNLARKIKARIQAEEKWVLIIEIATKKAQISLNTADLRNALEYLDNRDLGNTVNNVNHMHDKPIEMNVNIKLGERLASARKRALDK